MADLQRRRLLAATLDAVAERGVRSLSVAVVAQRAGVSRKTFYDAFDGLEQCLLASFEQAAGRLQTEIETAVAGHDSWPEQIRAGLVALLSFLDHEQAMGRLLIVEALSAGEPTLNARRQALDRVIAAVDRGRGEGKGRAESPPLTAEGVVGAVFSVIHARMLERPRPGADSLRSKEPSARPLTDLVRPLAAVIFHPYLGPDAAQRELDAPALLPSSVSAASSPADPFRGLGIRLTYRTALVLRSIAASPGASNKQVAAAAGIVDEGQTSRLLARLDRAGLVHNTGGEATRGEAKAWALTDRGEGVLRVLGQA